MLLLLLLWDSWVAGGNEGCASLHEACESQVCVLTGRLMPSRMLPSEMLPSRRFFENFIGLLNGEFYTYT